MDEKLIDPGWRPPTLTTPRLVLRALHKDDAPSLFRAASNPNVTRYTLWDAHKSVDDSLRFIEESIQQRYLHAEPLPFVIALKEKPAEVIGTIGAYWAERKSLCMELGFWIAEPYWGRGMVLEGSKTVLNWLFETYTVERVQSHCLAENAASARVIEKLGMQYEGTRRSGLLHGGRFWDLKFFATLRSDLSVSHRPTQ